MWYRNVSADDLAEFLSDRHERVHAWSLPPGEMPEQRRIDLLAEMRAEFPASFAEAAAATEHLSEQAIFSGVPAQLHRRRVALIGDAAHVAVPHIGAGSSLAVLDARSLAAALVRDDVEGALTQWAVERRKGAVRDLDVAVALGRSLQFHDHGWESWLPEDFDRWWSELMGDHRLYFDKRQEGERRTDG